MKTYRIKLKIESGTITPFCADTLFGHVCWMIVHREGEKELMNFLEPFKEGNPPFVISDGFPSEFLPKPFFADFLTEVDKDIKKIIWINIEDFNKYRKCERIIPQKIPTISFVFSTTHSRISRITNTTGKDSLYTLEESIGWPYISFYLKVISEDWKEKVVNLLKELSKTGYGRKKSIGKGQFSVMDIEKFKFPEIQDANGFVSLSNFCPAEDDPTEGLYKTLVKYGKLGEEFTFCGNPFKYPLVMIKSGSVFKTNEYPKEYYGRMVEEIAPAKKSVVQYAYAFAIPIKYPDLR